MQGKGLKQAIIRLLIIFLGVLLLTPLLTKAADFSDLSATLTDDHAGEVTTHTLNFTTATTSDVARIKIRYSTTEDGTTKPTGLSLSSATLLSSSGIGAGFSLDTSNAASGFVTLIRTPAEITSGTVSEIELGSITNSNINDCEPTAKKLSDTCFIKITSYVDDSETIEVDSGKTTYSVIEDPTLSFEISGIAEDETNNGITTTKETTSTSIPFGAMSGGTVNYAAHKLTISTNAPNGYTVYNYVEHDLRGTNTNNTIAPFSAINVTWNNPQPWQQPTGTEANSNTGWFGANTTDSRLQAGWAEPEDLFGPVSIIPHPVATSDQKELTPKEIFITYALGINPLQPADTYTTNLIYDVARPTKTSAATLIGSLILLSIIGSAWFPIKCPILREYIIGCEKNSLGVSLKPVNKNPELNLFPFQTVPSLAQFDAKAQDDRTSTRVFFSYRAKETDLPAATISFKEGDSYKPYALISHPLLNELDWPTTTTPGGPYLYQKTASFGSVSELLATKPNPSRVIVDSIAAAKLKLPNNSYTPLSERTNLDDADYVITTRPPSVKNSGWYEYQDRLDLSSLTVNAEGKIEGQLQLDPPNTFPIFLSEIHIDYAVR